MTDNSNSPENSVHSQVDEGDELRTCKTFEERLAKKGIFKKIRKWCYRNSIHSLHFRRKEKL